MRISGWRTIIYITDRYVVRPARISVRIVEFLPGMSKKVPIYAVTRWSIIFLLKQGLMRIFIAETFFSLKVTHFNHSHKHCRYTMTPSQPWTGIPCRDLSVDLL